MSGRTVRRRRVPRTGSGCKRYGEGNRVGSQDLQRFGGTCFAVHEADAAIVVTTSSFTAPATEYAAACDIVCVDGDDLAAWTESLTPPPWDALIRIPEAWCAAGRPPRRRSGAVRGCR
ncbi:restriction endonuclease [Streptomyces sp. NPDC057705]|uniref:restriction endonuclease n=1 Tax=Streptomyces sp. NPDC057705 TaxID=3346222 RepID=UPI0036C3F6AA